MIQTNIEATRRACIEDGDLLADGPPRRSEAPVQNGFIDGLFEQGKRWLVNYRSSAQGMAVYGYMVGLVLKALKEALPHGKYEAAVKIQFPDVSLSALQRFRQLADRLPAKYPTVGDLTPKLLKLASEDVPDGEKLVIVEAFKEATDSKCLTELCRDTDVIRKTKPPEHHPRKPVGAAEKLLSDEKAAEASCADLLLSLDVMHQWVPFISDAQREQLLDAFVDRSNLLRAAKRAASARHKAKAKG